MLYAYVIIFDVIENFKNFAIFLESKTKVSDLHGSFKALSKTPHQSPHTATPLTPVLPTRADAISHPKFQTPPAAASLPLPPYPNGVVIEGDVVAPFRLRRRLHPLGVFCGWHLRPLHPSHLEVRLFTPNHRRMPQSPPARLPPFLQFPSFFYIFFCLT